MIVLVQPSQDACRMTFRRFLMGAAIGALATTSLAGAASAQSCDTSFVLMNTSRVVVQEFYFNPARNPEWGRDRLGDGVVNPGGQMAFRPTGNATRYDFRVVWSNGENAELRNVDICSTAQIVATQRGIEAR
jgi:hypothetical protein